MGHIRSCDENFRIEELKKAILYNLKFGMINIGISIRIMINYAF